MGDRTKVYLRRPQNLILFVSPVKQVLEHPGAGHWLLLKMHCIQSCFTLTNLHDDKWNSFWPSAFFIRRSFTCLVSSPLASWSLRATRGLLEIIWQPSDWKGFLSSDACNIPCDAWKPYLLAALLAGRLDYTSHFHNWRREIISIGWKRRRRQSHSQSVTWQRNAIRSGSIRAAGTQQNILCAGNFKLAYIFLHAR